MASSADIYAILAAGVQSLNSLNNNLSSIFPTITASSTAVPASPGPITFNSSQPQAFMLVRTSTGGTVKIPYYSNP